MIHTSERRRVLLASCCQGEKAFKELFRRDPLDQWVTQEANTFSRARFLLQHNPCDVMVVHDDLYEREGGQGLAWLSWQREIPIVLLAGQNPEHYVKAYQLGVNVCLPRDLALANPSMLAAGLEQAMSINEMRFGYQRAQEQLSQSRKHMDRLVNLLWRASPRTDEQDWYPQRYMLERLSEELARTARHGIPLTVALGEITLGGQTVGDNMPEWVSNLILQGKRRCDLAGQYGTEAFLLLMVHTPKQGGLTCCRRLQNMLEQAPHALQAPHRPLAAYFGLATLTPDRNTPQALLRCAEEKLQAAHANDHERVATD
jgi:diguanylate cyclase (GGDEF)-like protein